MNTQIEIECETGEQLVGHLLEIIEKVKERLPVEVSGSEIISFNGNNCNGTHYVEIAEDTETILGSK